MLVLVPRLRDRVQAAAVEQGVCGGELVPRLPRNSATGFLSKPVKVLQLVLFPPMTPTFMAQALTNFVKPSTEPIALHVEDCDEDAELEQYDEYRIDVIACRTSRHKGHQKSVHCVEACGQQRDASVE